MKLTQNTVLITGGSSGIGLELSKRLIENKNKVIICGRSEAKLQETQSLYPEIITYPCDLSKKEECVQLAEWVQANHPGLNVLVNNAAMVHNTRFMETEGILEMAEQEIATNFLGPVNLVKLLHNVLVKNANPTLINVTTGLVYVPRADYPFYNATKAALHSFTQMLRMQLKDATIEIIEVLFPAVDTPWHKGNPPKIAISTEKAVNEMLKGLEKGKPEVRVAGVKMLYLLSRIVPGFALKKLNSLAS